MVVNKFIICYMTVFVFYSVRFSNNLPSVSNAMIIQSHYANISCSLAVEAKKISLRRNE